MKKQAEERKQAEKEAKAAAAAARPAQAEDDEDDDMDDAPSAKQQESVTRGRKRTDRVQIPDLLPAEFLTDSSSDEDEDDAGQTGSSRPKKRSVSAVERRLSRQDRGPRDERLGSTVYRVAQAADERLAPKAKKYSKSTKDVLLKRHRAGVKPRAGFFTKK